MSAYLGFTPDAHPDAYFISYNTEDAPRIGPIVCTLHSLGVPLWYDYGLEYGEKWSTQIAEHIHSCRAVVLFFTRNILEKEHSFVRKEYKMAKEFYNKKVFIVLMDNISNKDIPHGMVDWWIDILADQNITAFNIPQDDVLCRKIAEAIGFPLPAVPESALAEPSAEDPLTEAPAFSAPEPPAPPVTPEPPSQPAIPKSAPKPVSDPVVTPAQNTWTCAYCEATNAANYTYCKCCGAYHIPKFPPSAYWHCPSCGEINSPRAASCTACATRRPPTAGQAAATWTCTICNTTNSNNYGICKKCGNYRGSTSIIRPAGTAARSKPVAPQSSSWTCRHCGTANSSNYTMCKKCGKYRS